MVQSFNQDKMFGIHFSIFGWLYNRRVYWLWEALECADGKNESSQNGRFDTLQTDFWLFNEEPRYIIETAFIRT